MLQVVDPNVLSGDEDEPWQEETGERQTLLHFLADLLNPSDYSTHKNQLILAKQLVEHGANVNAVSFPCSKAPLHNACFAGNVTNLDFIEYLLKEGADPNAQAQIGKTPLMWTLPLAPGATKHLLNWHNTSSGLSFLAGVRTTTTAYSDEIARPDNPDRVKHQFVLLQWSEIEEMLVDRKAVDTGNSIINLW
jgi:hypothetical protein